MKWRGEWVGVVDELGFELADRWDGEVTYDNQLIVECARCSGSGLVYVGHGEADSCPQCGELGDDFFDPLPFVRVIGVAAALTLAFNVGFSRGYCSALFDDGDGELPWAPNVDGRSVLPCAP